MPRTRAGASDRSRASGPRREEQAASGRAMGIKSSLVRVDGQRFMAPLAEVAPSPRNVREEWEWEDEEFFAFADNVRQVGLIQDCAVAAVQSFLERHPEHTSRFGPDVHWVLIAGERRYRSAVRNGEAELPVVLRNDLLAAGDKALLSENNWRRNLSPLQEGQLFARISQEEGLSYDQIAESLGSKSSEYTKAGISKRVRLYKDLPDGEVRRAVGQRKLGLEPAYLLLTKLKEPALIEQAYTLMVAEDLTAKRVVARLLGSKEPVSSTKQGEPTRTQSAGESPATGGSAAAASDAPGPGGSGSPAPGSSTSDGPSVPTPRAPATGAQPDPKPVDPAAEASGAASPDPAAGLGDSDTRLATARSILAQRSHEAGDGTARRFALAILGQATSRQLALACTLVDDAPSADERRDAFLRQVHEGDDPTRVMRLADAAVMAAGELGLRSGHTDLLTALYVRDLVQQGGYAPTPREAELAGLVSSAKH